jgi:uncharacterized protein YbjT (DUF2867 family)
MSVPKTCVVIGATGLVGSLLVDQLEQDERFSKIIILSRRKINSNSDKVEQHIVNFDQPKTFQQYLEADILFCALGTTIKKARSQKRFFQIEHDLVIQLAKMFYQNRGKTLMYVSSLGAQQSKFNFYLNTKFLVEKSLQEIGFSHLCILRPSLLLGKRKEFRFLERVGISLYSNLSFLFQGPLKKYAGTQAGDVAKTMITRSLDIGQKLEIIDSLKIPLAE